MLYERNKEGASLPWGSDMVRQEVTGNVILTLSARWQQVGPGQSINVKQHIMLSVARTHSPVSF